MNLLQSLFGTRRILVIDCETASPIDLKTQGFANYWGCPQTKTLMTGVKWLLQPSEARVFDHEVDQAPLPDDVLWALQAPPGECLLAAANCEFDREALGRLGHPTPPQKWVDILVIAYILAFAGRLADVLSQVPLGIQKHKDGQRCISTFSTRAKAWHEDTELWDLFVTYCRGDAEVEEQLLRWCIIQLSDPRLHETVRVVMRQEQIYRRVNRRGIPVDIDAVYGARLIIRDETEALMDELRQITGLPNPNSRDQLLAWMAANADPMPNLRKATVRDKLLDPSVPADQRRVLELRQALAKTSVKKFDALARVTSPDGRLRNGWQFYGASRTGRVAGRTLNPANLARPMIKFPELAVEIMATGSRDLLQILFPEKSVLDTLSSCIRASLKAPKGKSWCVADLASIESVGLAWLAGCRSILALFWAGKDTYKSFASRVYDILYEEVTKDQRTFSKPGWLGFGYGLSGRGLVAYAASMGVTITEEEGKRQIAVARGDFHEIPHLWETTYAAAINAVENPGQEFHVYAVMGVIDQMQTERGTLRTYWYDTSKPRASYWFDGTFLRCRLPSGRVLSYFEPQVAPHTIHLEDYSFTVPKSLSYMGIDQKATSQAWRRLNVHGGLLVENNTQAMCRDIMWEGLGLAELDQDLEVVGDVYDEAITLCNAWDSQALSRLIGYMTTRPQWLDETFYLKAAGYISERYKKD